MFILPLHSSVHDLSSGFLLGGLDAKIAGLLGNVYMFQFYIHILFLCMIIPMGVLHTFLVILLIYCIFPYFRYSSSAAKDSLE